MPHNKEEDEEDFSGIDVESSFFALDATRTNNGKCSYPSESLPVRRKDGKDRLKMNDIVFSLFM